MTINIAINGLGRIGRCVVRALKEGNYPGLNLVAVNGPASTDTHLHLLTYDSTHGIFPFVNKTGDDELDIGFGPIKVFHERDPSKLPWKDLNIDVVLECTGFFTKKTEALKHIAAGAKKVLISAPSNDADKTIVFGVNNKDLLAEDKIISVGSCTTNCLAPVAKILNDNLGIKQGYMTTIHALTSDQNILDNSHKDLRRARSAYESLVPTSTGAAKALSLVIPELLGKLDGSAIRVPTKNVSCVDLTFISEKETNVGQINNILQKAADSNMKNIIAVNDKPLVSIDFNHTACSAIFDLTETKIVGKDFVRVLMWYDNEWGFSNRMLDVTNIMGLK